MQKGQNMSESFKPTPISAPSSTGYPWIFKIRCLIDLQMNTCFRFLRPDLAKIQGNILDVGAGQSPWRSFLPKGTLYQGIDISNSAEYGMEKEVKDIVYYDGKIMPFSDRSFDNVLCTEVLEHVADPELLLREIDRVLKDNGKIFFTIPWSARRHYIPYDFLRFTREKLEIMFAEHGFSNLVIKERGNDVCVIFNKILVLNAVCKFLHK
jgi:ubiquinone/menaquinone biosynthesis C-methylase UbiE